MSKHKNNFNNHFSKDTNPPVNPENAEELTGVTTDADGIQVGSMTVESIEMNTENEADTPSENEVLEKPVMGRVKCAKLNVRSRAMIDTHNIVEVIRAGDIVIIDDGESTDKFYKVRLEDGVEGFVMKEYIERT